MSMPAVRRGWSTSRRSSRSTRTALATGVLRTTAEVVGLLQQGGLPKGDALATARIAGIMAAKRTPDLVPLCHPLAISGVTVDLEVGDGGGPDLRRPCAPPTGPGWRWRRSPRSRSPGSPCTT